MADVFLARDLLLDRPVAIKVLFPEFATDPNFVERFRREAQAAANLNHPNIVSVYDWGKYADTYFMAMEYVQGRTLADILRANGHVNADAGGRDRQRGRRRARLRPRKRRRAPRHQAGQHPHRHQRPGEGRRLRHRPGDELAHRERTSPRPASVMGTATYFSPEQAQGAQPDPRSDLYSLGIVMYEMVAGQAAVHRREPGGIAYKQVHDQPQPLNQLVADVPRPFEAIVAKLLAKDPKLRYSNADALRDDLRRFRNGEPVQALVAAAARPGTPSGGIPRQPTTTSARPR